MNGVGTTGVGFLIAVYMSVCSSVSAQTTEREQLRPVDWVRQAVAKVCGKPQLSGLEIQEIVPQSWLLDEKRQPNSHSPVRITIRLALPEGDELKLESRLINGLTRQFRASYSKADGAKLQPRLLAIADGNCVIQSGRAIRHDANPWIFLDQLDGDLETLRWRETLQAPWPSGSDPDGVRVALVDSGLAYDLPLFRDRLARDLNGDPIGYDFWDLDPWPYDGDTSRGAFLPIRHGTAVASILAQEAPFAALVPYRYPRPDMNRMADIVQRAANDQIRILAMPLGSNNPDDWKGFANALKDQNILAIVSAGNNGRNIDQAPVYPAALPLENIITVTSADNFGRLASGSNWGRNTVDIMLPAENLTVTDFRGASGVSSGSSYAVPRLAALAARLLRKDPGLSAKDLKARILALATPSPFETRDAVSAGWIPDPTLD
ncbi:S8 family serine peptidase [uncultured Roseibium sp.]|uniref:S8 family serine peptidase n=1 Tax=uncultured Roseibium sp. TaxID=1936171 RepID=UPI00263913B6|nr:S8 family serine peptidase [uncultured Roseibium sp.]